MLVREVEATKKRYRDLRNDKVSLIDQQVGAVCESSSLCEYTHAFCKVDKSLCGQTVWVIYAIQLQHVWSKLVLGVEVPETHSWLVSQLASNCPKTQKPPLPSVWITWKAGKEKFQNHWIAGTTYLGIDNSG